MRAQLRVCIWASARPRLLLHPASLVACCPSSRLALVRLVSLCSLALLRCSVSPRSAAEAQRRTVGASVDSDSNPTRSTAHNSADVDARLSLARTNSADTLLTRRSALSRSALSSPQPTMDTPSALALALTLILALLSALAFVLLYLRSPWAASAAVARGNNKSHLHAHSHPGSHGLHHGHSHAGGGQGGNAQGNGAAGAGGGSNAGGHGHAHRANAAGPSGGKQGGGAEPGGSSSVLHNAAVPSMLGGFGGGLSSSGANASHLSSHLASSASSHSASGNHASASALAASASALSAADLALRGRKAKNNKQRGGGPSSSSSASSATSGAALPASSRGRISSSAGSSASSSSTYSLDFLSVAPPVIVCLTTLPSRVHHIDKCLSSLKAQSYPVHQILLVIPEESRREHTKYSVPDRVRKDAIITVVRVEKDYGPATRLITAWASLGGSNAGGPDSPGGGHGHAHDSSAAGTSAAAASSSAAALSRDTLLITLDDDLIYHPDTVATLVRHALAHPDSAVGFAGYSLRGRPYIQPNFEYSRRREERPDLSWKSVQFALQNQISYAAATAAANHATNSAALAAAAAAVAHSPAHHLSSSSLHVISPSLDPALLPCCDPLPDPPLDGDLSSPHAHPPNPNEVYESECVDVLCGWRGGLCVRRKFLDERLWTDYATLANPSSGGGGSGCCPEAAMAADDEWISAHLARNGVPRRVILPPFELVLGRLRLRHGRNSTSASHLAYQASVLECLVEEKKWMGGGGAMGNGVSSSGFERGGRSYSLSSSGSRGLQSATHSASSSSRTPFSDLSPDASEPTSSAGGSASAEADADAAAREAENLRRIAQLIQTIDVKREAIDGE